MGWLAVRHASKLPCRSCWHCDPPSFYPPFPLLPPTRHPCRPFCNSSHSLVVELAFKSTRLGGVKARAPRVTTGDEAAAAVANLTDSVLAAVGAELADDVAVEGEGE